MDNVWLCWGSVVGLIAIPGKRTRYAYEGRADNSNAICRHDDRSVARGSERTASGEITDGHHVQ